jgi:ankyrin repeat protein
MVVRRVGNRVQCRLPTGRLGWASVMTSSGTTPLLRLRKSGGSATGEQLSLRGQRSQETLGKSSSNTSILLHRVAVSPYDRPSNVARSELADSLVTHDVLSIVKRQPQQQQQQQALLSRPASAATTSLMLLRAGYLAAADGNLSAVRRIAQELGEEAVHVPDVGDGRTMLHHAAGMGQLDVVQYLLGESNAAPNAVDARGQTPLMHAAACTGPLAHLCAATLICGGADHTSIDARQRDAVHHAASHGNSAVLRILFAASAGLDARGVPLGRTPLHVAAENNHPVCVQLLIDGRADTNARTVDGMTAMHCAAWRGALGPMRLLLRAGADTSVRTQEGHTALDLSAGFGKQHCAQLLQSAAIDEPAGEGECDLEMFATPQQLIDAGLVVPLSDRVIAGLEAVKSCLDEDGGAARTRALIRDVNSTGQLSSSGRLRPMSAKSKAVTQLLTLEQYEKSKQEQQQISDGRAACDQENKNQTLSMIRNEFSSYTDGSQCDASHEVAIQKSSPATMASQSQVSSAKPHWSNSQTASAAVQHRVHLPRNRLVRRKKPASAANAGRTSAGAEILSFQGTVRSATLGWGVQEWERATCQFKLAATPVAHASNVKDDMSTSELYQAARQVHSRATLHSASVALDRGSRDRKQRSTKQRPHSAAAGFTRPWSSPSASGAQYTSLSASSVASLPTASRSMRRPGSAIPTTAQFQPPGVEEAAAHYLTTAQRHKRQEERLSLCKHDNGALQVRNNDSHNAAIPRDLSMFHSETREEREQREIAEATAATQIQKVVRGRQARQPV